MKLQRYNQFVKKINEDREVGKYDSVEDFRKTMKDEDLYDDGETMDYSEDEFADMDKTTEPMRDFTDSEDMDDMDDMDGMDDMDMEDVDDVDTVTPAPETMEPVSDFDEENRPIKLVELSKELNIPIEDQQINYPVGTDESGKKIYKEVVYYSETRNLHVDGKEFETPEAVVQYLEEGDDSGKVRDMNEARSYRFKRKSRF